MASHFPSTESLVPEYIRTLRPYVPGKPIEEAQREYRLKRVIKLASNENPLGPSPKALRAVQKVLKESHRYPDGAAFRLKAALSAHLGVRPDELILGDGSEEVFDFLIRTYTQAGDEIATSQAAFSAYKIRAQVHGVRTQESPLDSEGRFDLKALLKLVRGAKLVKLVFIANPNNPTGTYVAQDEMTKFLDGISALCRETGRAIVVVLDSAYAEYVRAEDWPNPLKLRERYPFVVMTRTFSKIYGLAGFRAGYAVARSEDIVAMGKTRMPFNLNSLAQVAAEAALGDRAFVKRSLEVNEEGMDLWEKTLRRMGIPYWPSQGNFLWIDTQAGIGLTGSEVYERCLRQGVIFRPLKANYDLDHTLRVSLGTPAENRLALKALERSAQTQ